MNTTRGNSRSIFGNRTQPVREFARGTILKSKSGLSTIEVRGFGFMGHTFVVKECHPLSAWAVGDRGCTGQDWSLYWEVV
jgi:hypothetical protein